MTDAAARPLVCLDREEEGRRWNRWLMAAAGGVTIAAAFGAPAMAAPGSDIDLDQPHQLPAIDVIGQRQRDEVSSPKATAPILDAPQTISVIPAQVLEDQGVRTLTEALQNTPGITFDAGENGFSTGLANFGIRGFDASGSIFVDGARDSGAYARDVFNIEQVEVFKGATGDNGRGAPGGYVNIVTKTPRLNPRFDATVGYGADDTSADDRVRATLDVNHPFAPGVAGRLNVLIEDGGVPGRAVAQRNSVGVAPSIAFGLDGDTRVILAAQYVEQDDVPDWGVPAAFIEGMSAYDPAIDGEALRDRFYGLSSDTDQVTSTVLLGRVEHDLSPSVRLTSQLRLADTDRFAAFTVPTGYAPATQLVTTQRQTYARENQSLSFLNNVSAALDLGGLRHRLSAGVEYAHDEASAAAYPTVNNPGTGAPVPVRDPNPDRAGALDLAPSQFSDVEVRTLSAYLFDTVELSPQWDITGGVRIERYDVAIDGRDASGAPLGADGLDIERTTTSGRLGVTYKPAETASLYASVGVAALPPASFLSTPDISREGDNAFPGYSAGINSPDARTQRAINYELGGKWELMDRALLATVALFRTERQNVAISGPPTITDPVELLGYGEQTVQGIELGLSGRITPQWSVFAGAMLLDSERSLSADLDLGRCRASPGDYGVANAAACGPTNSTDGDSLAFTPDFSANLWTRYDFDMGLSIAGGVRYVGESFVGRPDTAERIIPNNDARKLPDYWVASAMAEYAITPNVSVRLNVDNITDEFHAVSSTWAGTRVMVGPPRTALLSLSFRM